LSGNPELILNSNKKLFLEKEFKKSNFMDFVRCFEAAEYPELSFFVECDCIKRAYRNKLENLFVHKVFGRKNMVYVGFGSADLFPDVRMLTTLLIKNKIGSMHFIDPEYKHVIKVLKKARENVAIGLDDIFSAGRHAYTVFRDIFKFAQFLNFLVNLSGQKMELYVYDNVGSYLNICGKNRDFTADVVVAMDCDVPDISFTSKEGVDFFKTSEVIQKFRQNMLDERYVSNFFQDKEMIKYLRSEGLLIHFGAFPDLTKLCSRGVKLNGLIVKLISSKRGHILKIQKGPQFC